MGHFQEAYVPYPMAVNSTLTLPQGNPAHLACFLAITAGTITVTDSTGIVIINAFPLAAGVYYPLPFHVKTSATIVLAGGASGVLGVF